MSFDVNLNKANELSLPSSRMSVGDLECRTFAVPEVAEAFILLRVDGVLRQYPRSRSGLYQDISRGVFVRPVSLGARCAAFPQAEVAAICAARIAGKSDEEVRELVRNLHAARANSDRGVNMTKKPTCSEQRLHDARRDQQ